MTIQSINPHDLHEEIKKKSAIIFIDVRTPAEFESAHIAGSVNYPLNSQALLDFIHQHQETEQTIFITCQKGGRGKTACEIFEKTQITFKNLEGGVSAWIEEGLPVVEGKKIISLERQARIAAGGFVLLSVLFFYLGFSKAIFLALLVGLGLVFSGITDTCAMALVLAKMPWNQINSQKDKKDKK